MSDVIDKIRALANEKFVDIQRIRRHMHMNPELSFNEHQTSTFICGELDALGIEYKTGYVETGIVGHIQGNQSSDKVIALRADIDALPIIEQNDVPYKSKNEGVMHACGHDVHTSSLLGAAMILNELKGEFGGRIKLVFQPAEEKLPGGASLMIKEGALKNPDAEQIFGQHVFPELEVGKVGFRGGYYMASTDEIFIHINGKGGHAALPHRCTDTVLLASKLIVAMQEVPSRRANPTIPTVLSFGKIEALGATNIIPNDVKIEGTFRTMDEQWRSEAHEHIQNIAKNLAEDFGATIDVNIVKGYPVLQNDVELTNKAKERAIAYLGNDNVIDLDLRMTAEDFAYYSQVMPACFYRLGTRNEIEGITSNLHTPTFDVDEESLKIGAGLMAWMAISQLRESI